MPVKSSGDVSAEPASGQKIKEHVVTDLDLRNDENRPSLTSRAVAEECRDVSSKKTADEMADAVTGGNNISLWAIWPANILEKNSGILFEKWNRFCSPWHGDEVIFKTWCSTTQKRQKLVTEMYRKSYLLSEPQWRSSWQKLALFFSFTNLC